MDSACERFTIPVHAANRPRLLDVFLRSLEKNSAGRHRVLVMADGVDELPSHADFAHVNGVKFATLGEYLTSARWHGYRGAHIDVEVIPHKSADWIDGRPTYFKAWTEAMNVGIAMAETEWVVTGAQDDGYFAPNWDYNLSRWIGRDDLVCAPVEWLVPVNVYGFGIHNSGVLEDGAGSRKLCAYWEHFERIKDGSLCHVLNRWVGIKTCHVPETLLLSWLPRVGVTKPNLAVSELGGIRIRAGECPTVIKKSLFDEAGGYDQSSWLPTYTTLTLQLDDRLGAMGRSKVAVQDSVTYNTWYDFRLDSAVGPDSVHLPKSTGDLRFFPT